MLKTLVRILNWAKGYRGRIFLGFVCSFFATWFTAVPTMVAAWALGGVLADAWGETAMASGTVWLCLGAIIVSVLLRFFFSYWKARLQESIGHEIAAGQRIRIGDMLKRVSLGFFSKNSTGDILSAVTTQLSSLELNGMKLIENVANAYVNILAFVLGIGVFCPPAALVALGGAVLSAPALAAINRHSRRTAPVATKAQEALASASIEYIRGLPVVKSYGQQGAAIAGYRDACRDNKDIRIQIEKGFVPLNCLHLFALKAAAVALVLVTGWLTMGGSMGLPVFLMMAMFSFYIFGGVESVVDSAHMLAICDDALDKLKALENVDFIDAIGEEQELDRFDIQFENVCFGYEDGRQVLRDVTFEFPQGATTAIVGPSGGGKTTICNLVARFYDVDSGAVSIGGTDVRQLTCDSLLKNISMVFQNVYLFHDTVRNNIGFGRAGATEEEIVVAAKQAQCHDFIMALPKGYDTIVGESGGTLSGGEKQRISIARALLKDAPIIILDEATASVDPENEHLIQQAIHTLTQGKTVIVIAHRLATIENADQILVVENGRITQRGTHQELYGMAGTYQDFHNVRQKAEGWKMALPTSETE